MNLHTSSNLDGEAPRNDGCETVSGHSRIMLEIVPLRLEVSVVLEAQISWQAQHFVNLHAGEPQFPLLTSDIANFAQRGTHTMLE